MRKKKTITPTSGVSETLSDITIIMPTYDSSATLVPCLTELSKQEADIIKVLICDTGSHDGTPEMIQAQIKNGYWRRPCLRWPMAELDIVFIGSLADEGREKNVSKATAELLIHVTTPYVMRLDSDILLAPNTIKPMLSQIKADHKIGMLGLYWHPCESHVTTSSTIFRTEDARKIVWQWDRNGCDCLHAINQFRSLGFKIEQAPITARHLKYI